MHPTPTVTIAHSKRKLTYYAAGALGFVALGFYMALRPETMIPNGLVDDPALVRGVGAMAVLFFGAMGFVIVKKLRDPAPGLMLTPEGFVDNSGGLVTGSIAWADVTGLRELEIMRQKMLVVVLRDPTSYLAQQNNPFKRQLMKTNLSSYGSPIIISANALECTYPELVELFKARLGTSTAWY